MKEEAVPCKPCNNTNCDLSSYSSQCSKCELVKQYGAAARRLRHSTLHGYTLLYYLLED